MKTLLPCELSPQSPSLPFIRQFYVKQELCGLRRMETHLQMPSRSIPVLDSPARLGGEGRLPVRRWLSLGIQTSHGSWYAAREGLGFNGVSDGVMGGAALGR